MLNHLKGYSIPFHSKPYQNNIPGLFSPNSSKEKVDMNVVLKKLANMGAISLCKPCPNQFISKIFLVPKPDGTNRFILNLKQLNKFITAPHFKMEDYRTAASLIKQGDFLAKIDLRDAYLVLPVDKQDRKYLRFQHKGRIDAKTPNNYNSTSLYEFNALPFGLSSAPHIFTKVMKIVVAYLRERGYKSVVYLDDLLCIGSNYNSCLKNVKNTRSLLECLGFIINDEKSILTPSQSCHFLGYVFNSTDMTMKLPTEKRNYIEKSVNHLIKVDKCTIRELAHLIGVLIAACPAAEYGWVYTKLLERQKYLALFKNNDNYDAKIFLHSDAKLDLSWWASNIQKTSRSIRPVNFDLEIFTDASRTGWGGVCNGNRVNGAWKAEETKFHINYLELLAIFLALKSFLKNQSGLNILLRVDNKTAISYINRMGSIQFPHLNNLARVIWQWCENSSIWLFASYIKSSDNKEADKESRTFNPDTEWELNQQIFHTITLKLGFPDIDLFASRVNAKCKSYVSWQSDPEAENVDAFTLSWTNHFFYAFPPFSLILKCLQKIRNDDARGIMVLPYWPSQPWFPLMKEMLASELLFFGPDDNLLHSPFRSLHPLRQQLTLVAGILSGEQCKGSLSRIQH